MSYQKMLGGLQLWKRKPGLDFIQRSLTKYDNFYKEMDIIFSDFKRCFGKFVVLDLHAYNHRRAGPESNPADPDTNPEVMSGQVPCWTEVDGPEL